jgi:hypothetical protein
VLTIGCEVVPSDRDVTPDNPIITPIGYAFRRIGRNLGTVCYLDEQGKPTVNASDTVYFKSHATALEYLSIFQAKPCNDGVEIELVRLIHVRESMYRSRYKALTIP